MKNAHLAFAAIATIAIGIAGLTACSRVSPPAERTIGEAGALMASMSIREVAAAAIVGSPAMREVSAQELRQCGPRGLMELESQWAGDLRMIRDYGTLDPIQAAAFDQAFESDSDPELLALRIAATSPSAQADPAEHQARLEEAFRVVTGQHDGVFSGLYWHTDRKRALELARLGSKPVLSLRLLGRLDSEFC